MQTIDDLEAIEVDLVHDFIGSPTNGDQTLVKRCSSGDIESGIEQCAPLVGKQLFWLAESTRRPSGEKEAGDVLGHAPAPIATSSAWRFRQPTLQYQ